VAGGGVREIAALFAPAHDAIDHPADELAHRAFAIACARLAVEVLAGDDVCGRLRPALGHFDVFLAEDRHALFVADQRGSFFPFDLVERGDLSIGEEPFEHQSSDAGVRGGLRFERSPIECWLHRSHPIPPHAGVPPRAGNPYSLLLCARQSVCNPKIPKPKSPQAGLSFRQWKTAGSACNFRASPKAKDRIAAGKRERPALGWFVIHAASKQAP